MDHLWPLQRPSMFTELLAIGLSCSVNLLLFVRVSIFLVWRQVAPHNDVVDTGEFLIGRLVGRERSHSFVLFGPVQGRGRR